MYATGMANVRDVIPFPRTPGNADFVLDSFSGMVTGEIRSIVTEQIAQELDTLKQEKVSSTFEIVRVTYEPESDKVFVTGRNRMTGAGGKSSPTEQTFEFQIDVKQYSPIITQMASYAGMPKIASVLAKEEAKQNASALDLLIYGEDINDDLLDEILEDEEDGLIDEESETSETKEELQPKQIDLQKLEAEIVEL